MAAVVMVVVLMKRMASEVVSLEREGPCVGGV